MNKIAALLFSLFALNAHSANITPLKNSIGIKTQYSNEQTATFELNNKDGKENRVYKAEIYKWTQEGLQPTKDLVAVPAVRIVEPGKTYAMKVISKVKRTEVQQTYRIVFSYTLNSTNNEQSAKISMPISLSVPIFVEPTIAANPQIQAEKKSDGTWTFKNVGNATYKTTTYVSDDKTVNLLTYILPGSEVSIKGEKVELGTLAE